MPYLDAEAVVLDVVEDGKPLRLPDSGKRRSHME